MDGGGHSGGDFGSHHFSGFGGHQHGGDHPGGDNLGWLDANDSGRQPSGRSSAQGLAGRRGWLGAAGLVVVLYAFALWVR
ncbi:hypothetical protein P3T37_003541 [Kitasatospora sp. MAA4]|uniref:hypothetical protein n=1 Tax=Kitasatospora sp. MAA4 TaxID=3035093 RepID=UPI002474D516|nr:hypothetical protein [Kitasatospora sp. MAA4]MDH6134139.1 hypothetical protein [Kitasatospora sp. MAA4]